MLLTPAEVHNVAFSKPPIGKRGYNEDEVDQFLDLVEDTLGQLHEENHDLRQQVDELRAELAQGGGPAPIAAVPQVDEAAIRQRIRAELESELRAEYEAKQAKWVDEHRAPEPAADTNLQAARVLGLAQEMADRLTSDARAESHNMLETARAEAERTVAQANVTSERTISRANSEASTKVADATEKSEAMLAKAKQDSTAMILEATERAEAQIRQAEDKANALQLDAERKHTEIMATVKKQQSALEGRIAELRTFEREYRTRLKTYLESQLEELSTRGTAAPHGADDN